MAISFPDPDEFGKPRKRYRERANTDEYHDLSEFEVEDDEED